VLNDHEKGRDLKVFLTAVRAFRWHQWQILELDSSSAETSLELLDNEGKVCTMGGISRVLQRMPTQYLPYFDKMLASEVPRLSPFRQAESALPRWSRDEHSHHFHFHFHLHLHWSTKYHHSTDLVLLYACHYYTDTVENLPINLCLDFFHGYNTGQA
jgi:hypothetical protein